MPDTVPRYDYLTAYSEPVRKTTRPRLSPGDPVVINWESVRSWCGEHPCFGQEGYVLEEISRDDGIAVRMQDGMRLTFTSGLVRPKPRREAEHAR